MSIRQKSTQQNWATNWHSAFSKHRVKRQRTMPLKASKTPFLFSCSRCYITYRWGVRVGTREDYDTKKILTSWCFCLKWIQSSLLLADISSWVFVLFYSNTSGYNSNELSSPWTRNVMFPHGDGLQSKPQQGWCWKRNGTEIVSWILHSGRTGMMNHAGHRSKKRAVL